MKPTETIEQLVLEHRGLLASQEYVEAILSELAKQQKPVSFEAREIGESDWFKVGLDEKERIAAYIESPHMDYRWLYAGPAIPQPAAVPDGWKLVPVEPTPEMMQAGNLPWEDDADLDQCYRAMLSAAHVPPIQEAKDAEIARLSTMVDKLLQHCPDSECGVCASIVCPHGEPLHFHHDGCPSCHFDAAMSASKEASDA